MDVIFGLLIFGFACYYFYCQVIYPMQEVSAKNAASKLESYLTYDEESRILKLYGFHSDISKVVKMERYEILHTGYQPETITFTSVTVGNVTSGGVTKEDAYKYISGISKTDKYKLVYLGSEIKKIKLCGNNVKRLAIQLGLDAYMNQDDEIVVIEDMKISRAAAQAVLAGYYSAMQNEMLPGYPDEAKCRRILNFVCGNYTQQQPNQVKSVQTKIEPVGFVQAINCFFENIPSWGAPISALMGVIVAVAVVMMRAPHVSFYDDGDMYFYIFKMVAGVLIAEFAIIYLLGSRKYKNKKRNTSNADEIKKYKELLDMGAITQEEFDAKKKQLLGL